MNINSTPQRDQRCHDSSRPPAPLIMCVISCDRSCDRCMWGVKEGENWNIAL